MASKTIFLTLLLAGCTNTLDFTPTMASDPPQIGLEGIVLVYQLMEAYERKADATEADLCNNTQLSYQDSRRRTVSRYKKNGRDAESLFRCVVFKKDPSQAAVTAHVKAGFALSDLYCDTYFARISEHWGKRRFARNSTNDVGAMVSTVLGIASAGSGLTGGVGAAFGLSDALFRNYDENFLVDADLGGLQNMVRSHQIKLREKIAQENAMPDNYPEATMMILQYANLCSFTGMKGQLTTAMSEKTQSNLDGADPAEAALKAIETADKLKAKLREPAEEPAASDATGPSEPQF